MIRTPDSQLPPGEMKHLRNFCTAALFLGLLLLCSCGSNELKSALEPSQALGVVLAEEAARAASPAKQVVLIVPQWAASSTVGESFKDALKKHGLAVSATVTADVGDPMGRNPFGLKTAALLEAMQKAAGAGAVVSLAGAPLLKPGDAAQLGANHPPLLVVATASLGNVTGVPGEPLLLASLLDAKIVQLAIVDNVPDAPGPTPAKLDSTHQLFAQHYRILRLP